MRICSTLVPVAVRRLKRRRTRSGAGYVMSVGASFLISSLALTFPDSAMADGPGMRMMMRDGGMVMGQNEDQLPKDCEKISKDVDLTIHVGRKFAPSGFVYGYDRYKWQVPPCSRVHVTLINEDQVRHMWMVHNLPTYLYNRGMFNVEANGGKRVKGSLIVPGDDATLLAHCGVPQHTEKGLKGELVVGKGTKDLPSIPGITAPNYSGTLGN